MPDHFPSESGLPAETPRGRRCLRTATTPDARFSALGILSRDANTGASQGFTDLAAAVQLRLRVASGLQALQRCSGLLSRRARGSTVATHQPSPSGLRLGKPIASMERPWRAGARSAQAAPVAQIIRVRRFERRGCR